METTRSLAILLSVPEVHLLSGLESLAAQQAQAIQSPFIVYGSMDFEAFGEIEKSRAGKAVEVFIYASDRQGDLPLNPEVTWKGVYIGCEPASGGGRYRGKAIHRPASTTLDRKPSAIFWRMTDLRRFDTGMPIGKIQGLKKKSFFQPRFIPETPTLIEYPFHQNKWLMKKA